MEFQLIIPHINFGFIVVIFPEVVAQESQRSKLNVSQMDHLATKFRLPYISVTILSNLITYLNCFLGQVLSYGSCPSIVSCQCYCFYYVMR